MTFTEAVEKLKNKEAKRMRKNYFDRYSYEIKDNELIRVNDYYGNEMNADLKIDDYLTEDWEIF